MSKNLTSYVYSLIIEKSWRVIRAATENPVESLRYE